MATNTTNYNWTKPDYEDDADIKDLNDNFDGIDAQLKSIDDQVQLNKNNILSMQNNYVTSAITNTVTSFTPDTNCQYLIIIQSTTSSALYGVYKTTTVRIAKIVGNLTGENVTESDGDVTISVTDWSAISVIRTDS